MVRIEHQVDSFLFTDGANQYSVLSFVNLLEQYLPDDGYSYSMSLDSALMGFNSIRTTVKVNNSILTRIGISYLIVKPIEEVGQKNNYLMEIRTKADRKDQSIGVLQSMKGLKY